MGCVSCSHKPKSDQGKPSSRVSHVDLVHTNPILKTNDPVIIKHGIDPFTLLLMANSVSFYILDHPCSYHRVSKHFLVLYLIFISTVASPAEDPSLPSLTKGFIDKQGLMVRYYDYADVIIFVT